MERRREDISRVGQKKQTKKGGDWNEKREVGEGGRVEGRRKGGADKAGSRQYEEEREEESRASE